MWEWCEVGSTTSVRPKDQLCGYFQGVSIQTAGKALSAPMRSKARGSSASQLSAKLGSCRCSLQPGSHSSACEGSCQMCATCESCWPCSVGGHGLTAQRWLLHPRIQIQIPVEVHCACSLCGCRLILCVCAQTTKGCISWPSSVPALRYHFGKKNVTQEECSWMHTYSKRADSSCKQVVLQNSQIHGEGWS